jgi:hypothetical protein
MLKNSIQIMTKKYIEISAETLRRLKEGKYVEGSLHVDKDTDKIVFNSWKPRDRKRNSDRILIRLEHGWLKESAERYKFYSSVDKAIGVVQVGKAMNRELEYAIDELLLENIIK